VQFAPEEFFQVGGDLGLVKHINQLNLTHASTC